MIEELFIHWHSPASIANILHDYDSVNWHSIHRYAYALGLDAVRRRSNLRMSLEHLIEQAAGADCTGTVIIRAITRIDLTGDFCTR